MTFAYVGYVWALLGCSFLLIFIGVTALVLHLVGRRLDRGRAPRGVVEAIPLAGATAGRLGPALRAVPTAPRSALSDAEGSGPEAEDPGLGR